MAHGRDAGLRRGLGRAISVYDAYVREPAVSLHDLPGDHGHQAGGRLLIGSAGIVRLAPGHGHAMLGSPTANLVPGQTVTLVLTFAGAGELTVQAPVIALGADHPGGRQ